MKTSITTNSLSGDLQDKLSAISKAGLDGIGLFEQDFITFDGTPRELGELVRSHGLKIDYFYPARDLEGYLETQKRRGFDRLERMFDVMLELGTDLLLVASSKNSSSEGGIERISQNFRELAEFAGLRRLRIGYMAQVWGHHVNDYRDAWEVVFRAEHASFGMVIDSFHTLAGGANVDQIRAIPGDRIFHVQFSDAPMIPMDLEYLARHFRCMPGEGDLPLLEFGRAIVATGYDGAIGLEITSDQLRGGVARKVATDARRSLICLMDEVGRTEPGTKIILPTLPPKEKVEGVAFVEFATEGEEAEALGAALRCLGFEKTGQHVSKSVTLWQQGSISLVINSERGGFAHSAYVMHGTSVCDIGLMVSDAEATMRRAIALGANAFTQQQRAGELQIPAVRGVGGSILHFLDRKSQLAKVWDIEFRPVQSGGQGTGLTRIDHVAQTMNHDDMLTWTIFYLSILDLDKTPMVDVTDSGGVVHSRAIQSRDGRTRITMNGVETPRTFAGRFMANSSGSPVQHLAFATNDIIATAKALATRGFEALPISDNFYVDLAMRLDLTDDFVEMLKAHNVLYDVDEKGEFFQLYSLPQGDGFFFEIVERRGHYSGYGAANASYRTAAQKRFAKPTAIK